MTPFCWLTAIVLNCVKCEVSQVIKSWLLQCFLQFADKFLRLLPKSHPSSPPTMFEFESGMFLCPLRFFVIAVGLPGDSAPCGYSPNVLTQIPVKYLLNHAHLYQGRYSTLYPTLLKLTATQFPQLCLVCEWVTEQRETSCKYVRRSVSWLPCMSIKLVFNQCVLI